MVRIRRSILSSPLLSKAPHVRLNRRHFPKMSAPRAGYRVSDPLSRTTRIGIITVRVGGGGKEFIGYGGASDVAPRHELTLARGHQDWLPSGQQVVRAGGGSTYARVRACACQRTARDTFENRAHARTRVRTNALDRPFGFIFVGP